MPTIPKREFFKKLIEGVMPFSESNISSGLSTVKKIKEGATKALKSETAKNIMKAGAKTLLYATTPSAPLLKDIGRKITKNYKKEI